MKKGLLNMLAIAVIVIAFVGCKKAKEANTSDAEAAKVAVSSSEKYVVNVAGSTIEWKGFKPTGTHNGTVTIENGIINLNEGKIQSGTFLIDMKSIICTDLEGKMKGNLEAHLKGTVEGKEGDFFNVNKWPTGAFEITEITEAEAGKTNLSGNLTLKGVKQNITFPVTITNTNGDLTVTSDAFTIDRTKWGINYGSKSIFDNLEDKFINDDMELKISLKAKKS